MQASKQGIKDYLALNFKPSAVLIDSEGVILETSTTSLYFLDNISNIKEVFSGNFLEIFENHFDLCKRNQKEIGLPSSFKEETTNTKTYNISLAPINETQETHYLVVFQPMIGETDSPIEGSLIKGNSNEKMERSGKQTSKFENIINSLPGAVLKYRLDKEGKDSLVFISEQAEALWEVPNEEVLKDINAHWDLAFKEEIADMRDSILKSATEMSIWEYEWRIKTKSNKVKWLAGKGIPEKKKDGAIEWDTLILDITKSKKSELALKSQKNVLERTEAIANVGSWEWDIAKDKVSWSQELFKIFEIDPKNGEPTYKDHPKIYTPESFKELDICVSNAIKYGLPYELEAEIITGKGGRKYCNARGYVKRDENDKISHLYGSFQDISHRKIAEIKWKESQEDYKAITDSVPGVVLKYQLNTDGSDNLIYLSKGVEELHEIPQEKALEQISLIWERIHPDDLKNFVSSVQKSAEELSFWSVEYRILLPDGRVKWAQGRGMPKKMADGSIVWNTLIMDITERININQELNAINKQLDLAIETAKLGVWVLEVDSGVLQWNDTLLNIYGITREEFENDLEGWQKQVHPDDSDAAMNELSEISQGKFVSDVHFRIVTPKGETRNILASGAPLFKDNKVEKLIGINIDITQIKQNEEELIKAKEKAEASQEKLKEKNKALQKANTELDRFVYSVSHDLRSPIASSIGLSHLISETDDLEEIHHMNGLKIQTLSRLDQFIRDILDYSRNSRMGLKREEIDFKKLVDAILVDYHQTIKEKDINVTVSIDMEATFMSDKLRINIILNNLISNAFKFLPENNKNPFIEITTKLNQERVVLEVSDNGIGIEEERQAKIYEMFYRANDQKPGSGIGLYILKECVDKLKGEIKIKSKPNQGTTFIISIPSISA